MQVGKRPLAGALIGLRKDNNMKNIEIVDLTPESLSGYGRLLSETENDPMAENDEFMYWGRVQVLDIPGELSSGILVGRKRDAIVSQLERHIDTPEILTSLSGDSVIALAKSGDSAPDFSSLKAFRISQGQSFVMDSGTWHWIPFPVKDETRFLVLFAKGTEENDLEIAELGNPLSIGAI
jgi:ureidoglycolate lyase